MQIIIDIPEEIYISAKTPNTLWNMRMAGFVSSAIANGTPLPKGHGRLIDADALKENKYKIDSMYCEYKEVVMVTDIDDASTIIEADNAESEG